MVGWPEGEKNLFIFCNLVIIKDLGYLFSALIIASTTNLKWINLVLYRKKEQAEVSLE